MKVTVRSMRREELDVVLLQWARDLQWEPGSHDTDAYWAADAEGLFVAEVEEEEEKRVVGSVSGIAYGENYGFIGIYIVKEAFRGKGIGLQLFRHAHERLKGRNVGLDAVLEQEANYQKSGFVSYHYNVRYELAIVRNSLPLERESAHESVSPLLVRITKENVDEIHACDRWVFPERREEFLKAWVSLPNSATIALRSSVSGDLSGYVSVRKSHSGWRIGPLTAESSAVANALFDAAVNHVKEEEKRREEAKESTINVYLDVPESNSKALELVSQRGMKSMFKCVRMYTNGEPALDIKRIYGITTFELG